MRVPARDVRPGDKIAVRNSVEGLKESIVATESLYRGRVIQCGEGVTCHVAGSDDLVEIKDRNPN